MLNWTELLFVTECILPKNISETKFCRKRFCRNLWMAGIAIPWGSAKLSEGTDSVWDCKCILSKTTCTITFCFQFFFVRKAAMFSRWQSLNNEWLSARNRDVLAIKRHLTQIKGKAGCVMIKSCWKHQVCAWGLGGIRLLWHLVEVDFTVWVWEKSSVSLYKLCCGETELRVCRGVLWESWRVVVVGIFTHQI